MEFKQDINFLEYPLWMQRERYNPVVSKFTDIEGYTFEAAGGIPSKVDVLFLYYMLSISQQKNWSQKLILSRYAIMNACGINPSAANYKRLEESLHKWRRVHVSFGGTFYTGKVYSFMEFGIIDYCGFNETDKKLEIHFNEKWLEKIKASEFYKFISFNHMKRLRSPLALRLYEILLKTFYKRNTWEIDVLKLAAKIPMVEKYFADIVPKIEAAAKRIKEKTDLDITVKVVKQDRGKGKFIFTKKENGVLEINNEFTEQYQLPESAPSSVLKRPQSKVSKTSKAEPSVPTEITNLIPEEWRESVMIEVNRIFKDSGADILKNCIVKINYALQQGVEINSYGGYLRRCYEEKWYNEKSGSQIKAEKEALAVKKAELLRKKEHEERLKQQRLDKLKHEFQEITDTLANDRFKQLSKSEQEHIINIFENSMNHITKERYIKYKKNIKESVIVESAYNRCLKENLLSEHERNFELWLSSQL